MTATNQEQEDLLAEQADNGYDEADDVEIDLSEAVSFAPFDGDNVPVRVIEAELVKKSKSSGRPYIKLRVEVEAGHEHAGQTIWPNINLTGKGASMGLDALVALGATSKDGAPISEENRRVNVAGLPGLYALAKVRASAQPHELDEDGLAPDGYKPKAEIKGWKKFVSAEDKEAANLK